MRECMRGREGGEKVGAGRRYGEGGERRERESGSEKMYERERRGGRGKGGGVRECMRGNEEGMKVGGGRRMGEGGTRREMEGREREGGIGSCVV